MERPGFLHFDVRQGLCTDLMIGAMAHLVGDMKPVAQIFAQLGLKEISFSLVESGAPGQKGKLVQIDVIGNNPWIEASSDGEGLELIRRFFLQKNIKPTISQSALKILDQLYDPKGYYPPREGQDTWWLLCRLLLLVALVDVLDPKFISATRLVVGAEECKSAGSAFQDRLWLNQVLVMMPVIEKEGYRSADVLAVAFLKSLAGSFGARGESTILQIGCAKDHSGLVLALWCEAALPESVKESGPSNKPKMSSLYQLSGLMKATADMAHVASTMALHGARAMTWHLVYGEKQTAYFKVHFVCSDDDKREAIEAFLIKGEAKQVMISVVEHHELNRRLVSVPMGTGNKTYSARFHEYIYYDKTVSVEPVAEDLQAYVDKTSFSVDVARGDLLMAWKKWRGRIAGET